MKEPTKILHVVNLKSFGGIQKLVVELVEEMNTNANFVSHILSTQGADILKSSLPNDIKIIELPKTNPLKNVFRIAKLMNSYDVIHFHGPYTLFQIAALFSKSKIVYTEHGTLQSANINGSAKHLIQKKIVGLNFIKYRANAVIFVSNWLKNNLNLKNPNCSVIFNGLKYQEPKITKSDDVVITIAARIISKKRVDIAIEVMQLLNTHKNIKLQIIGNGPELERLIRKSNKLLDESVFFLDYRSDAYDLIASSDFYLMTTDKEPFGLVILEAMMNETIVLALDDSGGPVEVLGEKFPELIGATANDLAEMILKLSSNNTLYNQIGVGLKNEYFKNYTMNVMANNYKEVYLKSITDD